MNSLFRFCATTFFTALTVLSLTGCQPALQGPDNGTTPTLPTEQTTVNPMAFTVIQKVSVAQVRGVLPQVLQHPLVVVFKSKYCHDCQRMAPEIAKVSAQNTGVQTLLIDVQYDKPTRGAIISAYKPAVIPVVVAIQRGGALDDVMVGYHDAKAIETLYQRIAPKP
ncbi:MAG: thioredoxin family protein [Vampirovibrionales bacterium]|nr:thioredoxin family protein [Vampirovibrionales bacterium]